MKTELTKWEKLFLEQILENELRFAEEEEDPRHLVRVKNIVKKLLPDFKYERN